MAGLLDYLEQVGSAGQGLPAGMMVDVAGGLPELSSGPATGATPAAPAPSARPAMRQDLAAPEVPLWKYMLVGGLGGDQALATLNKNAQDPWKGKVATAFAQDIFRGRPTTKPVQMDEVAAWFTQVPGGEKLLGDADYMGRVKFIVDTWNTESARTLEGLRKAYEDEQGWGKNASESLASRVNPTALPAAAAASMALGGHFPEGTPVVPYDQAARKSAWHTGLLARAGLGGGAAELPAAVPGLGLLGQGPAPEAGSKTAGNTRERYFQGEEPKPSPAPGLAGGGQGGGYYTVPGKAAKEVDLLNLTAPAKARTAGMEEGARQGAQTSGHIARREADQRMPAGKWSTQTDPATGMQREVWTGGAGAVDLGRKPEDVGDMRAQVVRKALTASAQGVPLEQAFTPAEKDVYESTVKNSTVGDLLTLLGIRPGGVAGAAGGQGQPAPAPARADSPGAAMLRGAGLGGGQAGALPIQGTVQYQPGQLVKGPDGRTYRVTGHDPSGKVLTEPVR